jgi:DnaJ-class molecular chaperone
MSDRTRTEHDKLIESFEEEFGVKPPTHYIVCPDCQGRGTMTLQRLAVTQEQFDEDPDFMEDYLGGVYDEPCPDCHGRTTVLVIDEERLTPEQKEYVEGYWQDEYEYRALCEAERRAGC